MSLKGNVTLVTKLWFLSVNIGMGPRFRFNVLKQHGFFLNAYDCIHKS